MPNNEELFNVLIQNEQYGETTLLYDFTRKDLDKVIDPFINHSDSDITIVRLKPEEERK